VTQFAHHHETSAIVAAPPDAVFAHVDDPARLSAHMEKSSWAMGGGRMTLALDAAGGRSPGSRVRIAGRAFGLELSLEEIVTERNAPYRKVWQTTASPKLLVIGEYRMGFDVAPRGTGSLLRVFIDYALPEKRAERWLGRLFGQFYARWCTRRMVDDAVIHFGG
jgi:hypothetical protein